MAATHAKREERPTTETDASVSARRLRDLARHDVLAAFEGGLELLRDLVASAARHDLDAGREERELAGPAQVVLKLLGRLLREDARRREHEIDRESAWFALFETWLRDDGGLLDDFEGFLVQVAVRESDRRLLVRLASDELADLPLPFPGRDGDDVRRVVLRASRSRLEGVIGTLLSCEGRHAYALATAQARRTGTHDAAAIVASLIESSCDRGAVAALGGGRALRQRLETAFLRAPSEKSFQAVKRTVPADQWPNVCARLLGHLQKHQREPSLVFRLYCNEGLLVDADGLVVTQPVDPDVLAQAAMKLQEHDPVVAAGWLLVAACRLADSFPRSRWSDVISHLVLVRELTGRCDREGEFHRVLRTFRFRHAQSPDLLDRLSEVGL